MTDSKRPLWTELWELSCDMVNCTECYAAQPMGLGSQAFVHETTCSREGPGQYPYRELLEVLHMMRYADAPLPPGAPESPWTPQAD